MRIAALLLAAGATAAPAQAPLRELATDRPDKTESPQTVDAGRVQVELDVGTYTRDRADAVMTERFAVLPFNLKYGLGRDTDVQLVVSPYERETVTEGRARGGFGDLTVRLKQNIWGNDGGPTALALMPFVTLPTAASGLGVEGVEFGLIVPLSVELSDAIGLGLMTEVDARRADGDYHAAFINSATLGFDLTDRLGLYTEIYTEHDRDWIVTGDAGITYAIGGNAQIDAGVNLGLSDAADDLELFVGVSRRF